MRIVFIGSPAFAVPTLEALREANHDIPLVVTQPDRPAGRGRKLAPTAVKLAAQAAGLPVLTQDKGRAERERVTAAVLAAQPEAILVTAFGHILRDDLLQGPPRGCLNVHFSLLPRWRGVSPVQHAILHGDTWTGVTLMQMDAGVDTGAILTQQGVAIHPEETSGDLLERLAGVGADLAVHTLRDLEAGLVKAQVQNEADAVYAPRLTKTMCPVRWDRDAVTVHNQIRALDPFPGTTSFLGEKLLKIGGAHPATYQTADAAPGTVLTVDAHGVVVACGSGAVRLTSLQAPGRKMLPVAEFLRGFSVSPGQVFRS